MDELLIQNEIVSLNSIAANVEFMDSSAGLNRREFKRFCARLPERYTEIINEEGINFDTLDADKSGDIDADELKSFIRSVVKKCEVKAQQDLKKVQAQENLI